MRLLTQSALTAAALILGGGARAADYTLTTVNPESGAYVAVENFSSALLPAGGGFVGIGMFRSDPAGLGPTPAMLDAFVEYASGTMGGARVADADGTVFFDGTEEIDDSFNSQDIYVVFGDATDFSAATQFAVLDAKMQFPDDMSPPPLALDLDIGAILAAGGIGDPVYGTLTGNQNIAVLDQQGGTPGPNGLRLWRIPEPGSGMLGLFGIVLLFLRRRC